jgi:alpha-glucosidase
MLAFRKASPALRAGRTRFLDLPDPVLAFQRGEGEGAILCLFNLSADPHELRVTGAGVPVGPSVVAVLKGDRVTLAPHAAVFLPVTGKLAVSE